MTPNPTASLQQQFKKINFIGLAMMAAIFLYAAIVLGIDKSYIPYRVSFNTATAAKVKYILLVISLLQFFIIRFFRKFSLRSAAYLPAAAILTFALSETVSLYGLIIFLLTGNSTDFFIFMVISLLYFYLFYPKYADWEKIYKQK